MVVARATGGSLAPASMKGLDVVTSTGEQLQVKARVMTNPRNAGERQLSAIRSWQFEAAVIVLLDDEFRVWRASHVPRDTLQEIARHVSHTNSHLVFATDQLLGSGDDWTMKLRGAALEASDDTVTDTFSSGTQAGTIRPEVDHAHPADERSAPVQGWTRLGSRSRRQAWLREELVLALDLYKRDGRRPRHRAVEELSDMLRAIPIERHLAGDPRFRNPAAVRLKLGNFAAIDPQCEIQGMPHGGSGDRRVWEEFAHDRSRLSATARAIRAKLSQG